MDFRLQVSCYGLFEFAIPHSNPVILKTKTFSRFFISFMQSPSNFEHFEKNLIVIANVFPKLTTIQGFVTPLIIQCRLKTSFDSQHVKPFHTLVKSSWQHFYHIFSSLWGEIIWKISPPLKFEIIGLFINTWTADYKYPVTDYENLQFPIQIQLSWKQKSYSRFFISFMESPSNFEHFPKKRDRHS